VAYGLLIEIIVKVFLYVFTCLSLLISQAFAAKKPMLECNGRLLTAGWKNVTPPGKVEEYWEYLSQLPTLHTDMFFIIGTIVRGMPDRRAIPYRKLSHKEISDIVFRYYTTPKEKEKILFTTLLKAKNIIFSKPPYVYTDLQGIFLTTPDKKHIEKDETDWVDFKLDPAIPVIQLGNGIYLVPGPPPPDDYLNDLKNQPSLQNYLQRWKVFGWKGLEIPIKIEED